MTYLIDGHNLIPKVGLQLGDIDDEIQLVELLQEFCRKRRKKVEVYFDRAQPGQPRSRKFGMVNARFVQEGVTADEAIHQRLKRLGKTAGNWTVVSSDLEVQAAAREFHAQYQSSEAFAQMITEALGHSADSGERPEVGLSPNEVDAWLRLFGEDEEETGDK